VYFTVDRIESDVAVCNCMETGEDVEVRIGELPPNTKEGHVLAKTGDAFVFDKEKTGERLARMTERVNRLFQKPD